MPFLTLYTPTYKRPLGLARCLASVGWQTAIADIEQLVIPDHLGVGIEGMYARIPNYIDAVHGQYVHILCDDDELIHPEVVAIVKEFAETNHYPALILVGVSKGSINLPRPTWPPQPSGIDLCSMVVRSDVWKAHVKDYRPIYEGDYWFAQAVHNAGHEAAFCPVMFVRGAQSHGAAEAA